MSDLLERLRKRALKNQNALDLDAYLEIDRLQADYKECREELNRVGLLLADTELEIARLQAVLTAARAYLKIPHMPIDPLFYDLLEAVRAMPPEPPATDLPTAEAKKDNSSSRWDWAWECPHCGITAYGVPYPGPDNKYHHCCAWCCKEYLVDFGAGEVDGLDGDGCEV